MAQVPTEWTHSYNGAGYYGSSGSHPTYTYRLVPEPIVKWIMTDDQLNRLTALAREIALQNDLVLSTHTDKESFNLSFFEKDSEEEIEGEE